MRRSKRLRVGDVVRRNTENFARWEEILEDKLWTVTEIISNQRDSVAGYGCMLKDSSSGALPNCRNNITTEQNDDYLRSIGGVYAEYLVRDDFLSEVNKCKKER